jgi:hypothetical protein
MSDVMLFGVLRMPYELAMADEVSRFQFYDRAQEAAQRIEDYEEVLEDHRRLVRELDVLLHGDAAAKQASLCDIVGLLAAKAKKEAA